jgi:hypothetical protein
VTWSSIEPVVVTSHEVACKPVWIWVVDQACLTIHSAWPAHLSVVTPGLVRSVIHTIMGPWHDR